MSIGHVYPRYFDVKYPTAFPEKKAWITHTLTCPTPNGYQRKQPAGERSRAFNISIGSYFPQGLVERRTELNKERKLDLLISFCACQTCKHVTVSKLTRNHRRVAAC